MTMMKVELKQLNIDMAEQEYEMLQGILDIENGFTNPAYSLSYKKYQKWLQEVDNHSRGIDLPKDWIPYTTYFLYIDDIPVGYGRIRHSSSEYLETVSAGGTRSAGNFPVVPYVPQTETGGDQWIRKPLEARFVKRNGQ